MAMRQREVVRGGLATALPALRGFIEQRVIASKKSGIPNWRESRAAHTRQISAPPPHTEGVRMSIGRPRRCRVLGLCALGPARQAQARLFWGHSIESDGSILEAGIQSALSLTRHTQLHITHHHTGTGTPHRMPTATSALALHRGLRPRPLLLFLPSSSSSFTPRSSSRRFASSSSAAGGGGGPSSRSGEGGGDVKWRSRMLTGALVYAWWRLSWRD